MLRLFVVFCAVAAAGVLFATDAIEKLPRPHYRPQESDAGWLKNAAQFHGHLGPMMVFGARMGMAALHAVDAKGYFDVEIKCEGPLAKPPASCFLDGLQVSTGATLGKRNLEWIDAKKIAVYVKNTETGKTAAVRPSEAFLALLRQQTGAKPSADGGNREESRNDHHFDDLARKIAAMPEKQILTVDYPK
jgi:formylmethanofuran dehydrogenase subunit E